MFGGLGADVLTTGGGNDGIYFGQGRFGASDSVNGGAGVDRVTGNGGSDTLTGGSRTIAAPARSIVTSVEPGGAAAVQFATHLVSLSWRLNAVGSYRA